jgi:hypothetical protein
MDCVKILHASCIMTVLAGDLSLVSLRATSQLRLRVSIKLRNISDEIVPRLQLRHCDCAQGAEYASLRISSGHRGLSRAVAVDCGHPGQVLRSPDKFVSYAARKRSDRRRYLHTAHVFEDQTPAVPSWRGVLCHSDPPYSPYVAVLSQAHVECQSCRSGSTGRQVPGLVASSRSNDAGGSPGWMPAGVQGERQGICTLGGPSQRSTRTLNRQ